MAGWCARSPATTGQPGQDVVLGARHGDAGFRHANAAAAEQSVSCVLLDAVTGDVLALVSSPSYDPMLFSTGLTPGGVAGAVDRSAQPADRQGDRRRSTRPARPSSRWSRWPRSKPARSPPTRAVTCPGYLELGDATFHCWQKGGHGTLHLRDAIKKSCDVFFYETARRTGIDHIAAMAQPLRLRRPARPRHSGRARRADPDARLEAGDHRRRLAAGRDADRRHRPGLGAGDAAAAGDDGGAPRHRPRGRAASGARAAACCRRAATGRLADFAGARRQPARTSPWCSTA